MKQLIRITTIALCMLLTHQLPAQSIGERVKGWLPRNPSTSWNMPTLPSLSPQFKLSSLGTPEAISSAIRRIASLFSLLSPTALIAIQKSQYEKLQENLDAYAENPSWAHRGAIAANALAIAAATVALAGEAAVIAGVGYRAGQKIKEPLREKPFQETEIEMGDDPMFLPPVK